MATKKDARSLMRRLLGKKTADAFLHKVDNMIKKEMPPRQIEKQLAKDLATHINSKLVPSVNGAIKVHIRPAIEHRVPSRSNISGGPRTTR